MNRFQIVFANNKPQSIADSAPNIQPINRFNPSMQLTAAKTQKTGVLLSYNKMFATETDLFPIYSCSPRSERAYKTLYGRNLPIHVCRGSSSCPTFLNL
mgnify:CR=1 FL=1